MIKFKDVSLREGSQTPGSEISDQAGIQYIRTISNLGVNRLELSFPAAESRESWYREAEKHEIQTTALARALSSDVDAALAVNPTEIEIIITTSDIQLEYALGKTREEARELFQKQIDRVINNNVKAGVTFMDAIRADNDYIKSCAAAALNAGADSITIADTPGVGTLDDVRNTVAAALNGVEEDIELGIHAHDDLGIATANSAIGVAAGATRVDATIGGIGERAGNTPLEEIAILLEKRGHKHTIFSEKLIPTCREALDVLGIEIPSNKAVLGDLPYRHESGLHTAAMLRKPETYEAFNPAKYGGQRELLFGSETGTGAVRTLFMQEGISPTEDKIDQVLNRIMNTAQSKNSPLTDDHVRDIIKEMK